MRHANCRCSLEIYSKARMQQRTEVMAALLLEPVPRQNSIRAENRAIPCRDNLKRKPGWDLRARRLSPGVNTRAGTCICCVRMDEPLHFRDATRFGLCSPIVPVVQPSESHMTKNAT